MSSDAGCNDFTIMATGIISKGTMWPIRAWPDSQFGRGVLLFFEEIPNGKTVKQKICELFGKPQLAISLQTTTRDPISNSTEVNQGVIYKIEHGTNVTFRLDDKIFEQPFPSDWTARDARIFLSRYIFGCHLDDLCFYVPGFAPYDPQPVNDDEIITLLASKCVETMVNRQTTKVYLHLARCPQTIYLNAYARPEETMADVQRVLAQTMSIMACQIHLMVKDSERLAPLDPQWRADATVQSYGSIYFKVYSSVVHFQKPSYWLSKTASIRLEEDLHDNREFFQQRLQQEWRLTKKLRFSRGSEPLTGENLLLVGSRKNLPILCTELEEFTFLIHSKENHLQFSPADPVQFVKEQIQKRFDGAEIAAIKRGKKVLKPDEAIDKGPLEVVFLDNRTVIVNRKQIGYMNDTTTVAQVKEMYSAWLKRHFQSQQVFSRFQLLTDTDMASGHGELFIVDPSQSRKCSVTMKSRILLTQDVEIGKTIGFLRKLAEDKASEELIITLGEAGNPIPDDQFIFTFLCNGDAVENNFMFYAEPMAINFTVEINNRWVLRFRDNRNKMIQDLAGLLEETIGCKLTSLTDANNHHITTLRDAKQPLKASIQGNSLFLSIHVREERSVMEKIIQLDINGTLADLSVKLGHTKETCAFYTRDGDIGNTNARVVDVVVFSNKPIEFRRRRSTSARKLRPTIVTEQVHEPVVQKPKEQPKIQISLIRGDEILEQWFEADQTIEDVQKRAQPLCNDHKKCRYQVADFLTTNIINRDVRLSTLTASKDLLLAEMVDVYFMVGDKYEKILEVPSSQNVGSILEKDILCLKVGDDTCIVSQSGVPVDPSKEIGQVSCSMAVLLKAIRKELLCTINVVFLEQEAKEYQVDGEAPVFSFVDFLMRQKPFEVIVEDEAGPVSLGSSLKDIKGVLTCKTRETEQVDMSERKIYRFTFGEKLLAVILPKNSSALVAKREIADLVCTVDDLIVFTFRNGIVPDTLPLDDLGMLDETIGVIVMNCGSCFLCENSQRDYKNIQPIPLPELIRPENFDDLVERLYEFAQRNGIRRSKVECKRLLNKCEYRFDDACKEITA